MATQLIINADDFGFAAEVNSAVQTAHRDGILTSASLMVTGEAVDQAIEVAGNNPRLAVGLHLVLSRGRSLLGYENLPNIVDSSSRFDPDPTRAGLRYFFSSAARAQLRMEVTAQFEAFAKTGLKLSHVDGHQHMHAHPAVLPIVIELADSYGAAGIRIPNDPFLANRRIDGFSTVSKLWITLGHIILTNICRQKLRNSNLVHCDASIGVYRSGNMNDEYAIQMLKQLNCNCVEMFFHPADLPVNAPPMDDAGPNAGDLAALLSPRLRAYLDAGGYELTTYPRMRVANGDH